MESIARYVQDPGWWFTAVFVGIIGSVIAGLLVSPIQRGLAAASSRFREWRGQKLEARERWLVAWSGDGTRLVIAVAASVLDTVGFVASVVMTLGLPVLVRLEGTPTQHENALFYFLWGLVAIASMVLAYGTAVRFTLISTALKRYTKAHGLPAL